MTEQMADFLENSGTDSEAQPEKPRIGRPPGSKTKKTKFPAYQPIDGAEDARPTNFRGGTLKEIRLPLNDAGNVDVNRMRADTLERARQLLSDPSTRQAMGITEQELLQFVMTDEDVTQLYQLMGAVECWIATRFRRIPADIAAKHLPFNQQEVAIMNEPTKAMAAKYIPASWMMKKDEAMFFGMLIMFHRSKWADANHDAAKRREQENGTRKPAAEKEPVMVI